MGKNRTLTSVFAVSALALTLVSCSGDKPSPQDAAEALAAGLAAGDAAGLSFAGTDPASVTADLEELLADMGEVRPAVSVAGVEEADGEDTATASLSYAWDFNNDAAADWSYTTSVSLARAEDDAWQVNWEPAVVYPDLSEGERLVRTYVQAPRAEILGAGGQALVTQRAVFRVGIDKTKVDGAGVAASAAALAGLLELDPAAYTASVEAAGAEAFVEAITVRSEEQPDLPEKVAGIPGAAALPGSLELAPSRTFARALLGSVGEATAELIENSEGSLSAGDRTGLSGLQQQYDAQLRGTDGTTVSVVDAAGDVTATAFSAAPVPGTPLTTTLDARLQTLAESVLEDEPSASAIVALRPSTGEVVTVANGPGSEGQQTALLGQYPPGSTFKIATSLALLRQGTTPDTALSCPAELLVDGRKFNNASSYPAAFVGEIPLRDAFAQSCNTAFIGTRDTISQEALAGAAADLGIGVEQQLGAPAFFGSVPETAQGTNHAASMIGQGQVLASPLAMAVAAASVGAGERVAPVLVAADTAAEAQGGSAPASASPSASASSDPARPADAGSLTAAEATALRELMRGVVTEGGASMLLNVPGEPVLAKTGTAEFGSETPPRTHAWVVALQGDLAVAVFVAEGELGSTSGGPLMKAFLDGAAG